MGNGYDTGAVWVIYIAEVGESETVNEVTGGNIIQWVELDEVFITYSGSLIRDIGQVNYSGPRSKDDKDQVEDQLACKCPAMRPNLCGPEYQPE